MAGKKSPGPEPILGKLSPYPINTSEQGRGTTDPKDLASPREPKRGGGISMSADLQANTPHPKPAWTPPWGFSFLSFFF